MITSCGCVIGVDCDPDAVMMKPIEQYQLEFPLISFHNTDNYTTEIKVLAAFDNTLIYLDGAYQQTLNAGNVAKYFVAENFAGLLLASSPITVVQFGQAYSKQGGIGDRLMAETVARDQFITGNFA